LDHGRHDLGWNRICIPQQSQNWPQRQKQ